MVLLEALESRTLFDGEVVTPIDVGASAPISSVDAAQSSPGASWLTPAAIRGWYGYNGVSFKNGTVTGDGTGQTIAIIDWGYDANIGSDLKKLKT